MSESLISLLYTTARPHIIEAVIDRWLRDDLVKTEMIVVTDDPYLPSKNRGNVNYVKNNGRRDCVTGWNLAAQNSVGDILIQVSDDLFPPEKWDFKIRELLSKLREAKNRSDIVLNLLDERRVQNAVFHPVLTRASYKKMSYLYPPEFQSMYCDNWFCLFHRKHSIYAVSQDVFWHHKHRATHEVEVDEVMKIHESPERFRVGLETLKKYIVEHKL